MIEDIARFNVHDVVESYPAFVRHVLTESDTVTSRGYTTYEITNFTVVSNDPRRHMIWDEGTAEHEFLESEIATVREGEEPDVQAEDYDDKLDLDDGTFYEDVIRERISEDWDEWVRLLTDDSASRKACSLFGSEPDPPCTSRIQWLIRQGKLHCFTYNRSQELLFAYPMDMGLFERYQCELAEELGLPVGRHEHTMTSAHIYSDDVEEAKSIANI